MQDRCRKANDIISLIGDKWLVHIVMHLGQGTRRFSQIRRAIDGISQKMLTVTLRGLERDGYVKRTAHAVIPPRVDYEMTHLGSELLGPLTTLGDWAIANHDTVLAARAAYDGAPVRSASHRRQSRPDDLANLSPTPYVIAREVGAGERLANPVRSGRKQP